MITLEGIILTSTCTVCGTVTSIERLDLNHVKIQLCKKCKGDLKVILKEDE